MRKVIIPAILLALLAATACAFSSEEQQQLWDVPTGEVRYEINKSYLRGNIKVEEVYYYSRPYLRQPTRIFGYFAYPKYHRGKLPAILLSHGGGGTASLPRSISWARHGYAVLSIDLPGKGENRPGSRSTGPDMIVANLLRTQPDPSHNYLVYAVAAARNGITFLTQRQEVNPQRIGMVGLSWGGVLTLLTNGQDSRLRAAVNVFGAGYIPEGCTWEDWFNAMPALDKEIWMAYLDPKNFLATQHAPILFITGTNDHCYYLPTFQKSYEEVTAKKNYYLIPNLRHRFLASAQDPAFAWLDQRLKRGGSFPTIEVLTPFQKGNNRIVVPVKVSAASPVTSVRLYYTLGGPQQWTTKKWLEIRPHQEKNISYFSIPEKLLRPEVMYFVSAKDSRGGVTSSLVSSLFAVQFRDGTRSFANSAAIKKIYRHEKPIRVLNGFDSDRAYFLHSKQDQAYLVLQPQ
ncbi:MAG: alpha/beta fold hydrolase [Candidatus Margulisiibacteriota bacterium]